jgi:hypothetical protein
MVPDEYWRNRGLDPVVADQVGYIVRQFRLQKDIAIGVVIIDHAPEDRYAKGVSFMYAKDQLIVREQYRRQVEEILARRFGLEPTEVQRVVAGIVSFPSLRKISRGKGKPPESVSDNITPGNEATSKGNENSGMTPEGDKPSGSSGSGSATPSGGNGESSEDNDKCPECGEKQHPEDEPCVLTILAVIDKELGKGIATPNHVLTVAGDMGPCPATEPQGAYDDIEPYPSVCPGNDGAGVLVYVADTGFLTGADTSHSWLAGVTGDPDPLPPEVAGPQGQMIQPIPAYTGHGTFVAGVIRCMAPGADLYVANAFLVAGSSLEVDFVQNLEAALGLGVDIFHLSVTAPTRWDLPLLSFEGWMELLHQYKGVVCVVAAGNNGNRLPCWPAAFPGMVSVGALAADWHSLADFSNYGGWVDVYAPGRSLINAYATGTYTCHVAPYVGQERQFYGMARWSGTSFSTPIVTGLIAARMSRCGESGQQAAAALLAQARAQTVPGVGAILLPCCGNGGDKCRDDGCDRCSGSSGGCGGRCGGRCGGCGPVRRPC